jgi:hypothetical protein
MPKSKRPILLSKISSKKTSLKLNLQPQFLICQKLLVANNLKDYPIVDQEMKDSINQATLNRITTILQLQTAYLKLSLLSIIQARLFLVKFKVSRQLFQTLARDSVTKVTFRINWLKSADL